MPKHAPKGKIKGTPATDELTLSVTPDTDALSHHKGLRNPKGLTRRCTAHSKTSGKQCAQPAIPGATVCHYHGGAAPQVKAKAEERLLALQHPAIDTLSRLIDKTDEFPSTAYQAARDVLDRTMGKAIERRQEEVRAAIVIQWKT